MKKIFFVALFAMFCQFVCAETAYEKKCNQIYVKYYTLFTDGYSHGLNYGAEIMFLMSPEFFTSLAIYSASEHFTQERLDYYIEQMGIELKNAQKLMSPEEKKQFAEKESLKKMLRNEPVKYLCKIYHAEFDKWAEKSEFETTAEYETRLKQSSRQQLEDICLNVFPISNFKITPVKYDADNSKYKFRILYGLGDSYTDSINILINMDVDFARNVNNSQCKMTDVVFGCMNGKFKIQSGTLHVGDASYPVSTKVSDLIIEAKAIVPNNKYLVQDVVNISNLQRMKIDEKEHLNQMIIAIDNYNNNGRNADSIYKHEVSALLSKSKVLEIFFPGTPFTDVNGKSYWMGFKLGFIQEKERYEFEPICCYAKNDANSVRKKYNEMLQREDNCKFASWEKYASYFQNKSEYDTLLDQGCEILSVQMKLKFLQDKIFNTYKEKVIEYKNRNFMCAYDDVNPVFDKENYIITNFFKYFTYVANNKMYSAVAADVLVNTNVKMHEEYLKNGSYFANKTDFISAYFSDDYKKIIKSKIKASK